MPLTEFHRCASTRDGLENRCKRCKRELAQRFYAANREQVLEQSAHYYEQHREQVLMRTNEYHRRKRAAKQLGSTS